MVMETLQIRLTPELVESVDSMVERGAYPNRSDAIRDAVRRMFWNKEVGHINMKGDGVKIARKARAELSEEKINLKEINRL
mgnify:CR=1 FL=1